MRRLDYLTASTRGLLLAVTAWEALIVALLGANLAFTVAAVYESLPPDAGRAWTTLYLDIGLGLTVVVLAGFLGSRLLDLFRAKGHWTEGER